MDPGFGSPQNLAINVRKFCVFPSIITTKSGYQKPVKCRDILQNNKQDPGLNLSGIRSKSDLENGVNQKYQICGIAFFNWNLFAVSSAITQLVAILAKHELAAGGWPELLQFLQVTNQLVTMLAKHELAAGGWPRTPPVPPGNKSSGNHAS